MAKVITDNRHYADIAEAIRTKNETDTLYKPAEMASAILDIQCGASLNFEVVGGTTRPSNPKENTIWVNTNREIVSCALAATAPTAPTNGMLWIEIGGYASVFIEVVEDSGIVVGLSDIKLYYDGAWNNVEAQIYQGGEWDASLTSLYLVKNGEANPTYAPVLYNGTASVKKYGDVLLFAIENNNYCAFYSANKIPLNLGYDHAVIEVTGAMSKYDLSIGVTSTKTSHTSNTSSPFGTNRVSLIGESPYVIEPQTLNLDLSALTSPMWFGLSIGGSSGISNDYFGYGGIEIKTIKLVRK